MVKIKSALFAAGVLLAMAFTLFAGCTFGGCQEPDDDGTILAGSGITYEKCIEAVEDNSRCTSGGLWSRYDNDADVGECRCYAESCEEDKKK